MRRVYGRGGVKDNKMKVAEFNTLFSIYCMNLEKSGKGSYF